MDGTDDAARVAIVTGAGHGLGAAFAKTVAASGTRVVVNNRRHADRPFAPDAVIAEIEAAGGTAMADDHAVDAEDGPRALIEDTLAHWGRLDAIVLNAGISGPAVKIGEGDAHLREVMEINFFANDRIVRAALPHLRNSPAPRIVIVSSTGGLYGVRGRSAYAASKGAITAYALSLADELRRTNMRVNVLTPYAATKMTAQPGRDPDPLMAPEGAADACAWAAGPQCDVTGQIIVAGAGHVRLARAMESHAVPFAPDALQRVADLPDARGFDGGEAAFADFYQDITQQ
jgi:3-hydroxyacyl-CoA dehydrogenase/3a,7a,12a-trihydroxy-5b-cholest-24-enoyl-CoA hydratase